VQIKDAFTIQIEPLDYGYRANRSLVSAGYNQPRRKAARLPDVLPRANFWRTARPCSLVGRMDCGGRREPFLIQGLTDKLGQYPSWVINRVASPRGSAAARRGPRARRGRKAPGISPFFEHPVQRDSVDA
jgi:hypothetical protein